MPTFKSRQPDISVPGHLPIWTWLFDSEYSPLNKFGSKEIKGYTNALTKEHLSYADIKQHSTHLSTVLAKDYGLKEGETVSLFSPNTVWYPVAMFGTLRAGGVVSGASPAYGTDEMTYALQKANSKILFTVPSSMDIAATAAKNAGIPKEKIFLLEGHLEGYKTMSELLKKGASYGQKQIPQFKLPSGKQNKDVCGFLSFSSGTTGLPKAVQIAHSNVIGQCLQIEQITPETLRRILAVLPLFHITGLVHQLHLPVLLNANVYMLPTFTMDSMYKCVEEYKLEEMLLVPPILIRMTREKELLKKYDMSSVKRFSSGAAPLSAEILDQLQQVFPGTATGEPNTGFKQGYGMTESCSCITAHPPDKYNYKYAFRVGTIVASTEVKIIDPASGKECDVGEPGEICARGPQIVMGYLNNEQATKDTFDEQGFLHTGDIGKIDDEGLISIVDRAKELIKVKGEQVAPAELEDLLLGHPDVTDVAVLGILDDYSGERPKAYIVLNEDKRSQSEEAAKGLIKYVQQKKVRHKWIKEIELIEEIPKSASGKILRRVLRDMAKEGSKGIVVKDETVKAKI